MRRHWPGREAGEDLGCLISSWVSLEAEVLLKQKSKMSRSLHRRTPNPDYFL